MHDPPARRPRVIPNRHPKLEEGARAAAGSSQASPPEPASLFAKLD